MLNELDAAIVTGEFAAKGQEEVLKRELMTRLASVHVENKRRLLGNNEPIIDILTTKIAQIDCGAGLVLILGKP